MNVRLFTEVKRVDGNNDGGGDPGEGNVLSVGPLSVRRQWSCIEGGKMCSYGAHVGNLSQRVYPGGPSDNNT